MTTLRKRQRPQTQWNRPACESCTTYGIEVVRTTAGARLYEQIQALYPKRPATQIMKDLSAEIEARVVACEHLAAEGGSLQNLSPEERRMAGLRPTIWVHTRIRPVIGDTGEIIATGSAWTDEGAYSG